MRKSKIKSNRNLRLLLLVVLCSVTAIAVIGGITYSKYMIELDSGYVQADANAFYFGSDKLVSTDESIPTYKIAVNSTSDATIDFTLTGAEDEFKVSDVTSISYSVTAKVTSNSTATVESTTGTFNDVATGITVTLSIPADAFVNGVAKVEVIASATAPYTAEINAIFELYAPIVDGTYSMTVQDQASSNVVYVKLATQATAGSVTIGYPSAVYPDRRTNSDVTINDDSSVTVSMDAYSEYELIFFKSNSATVYTSDSFTSNAEGGN